MGIFGYWSQGTHFSENWYKGKKSNTYPVFPSYTVPQCSQIADEGKFFFTEEFQIRVKEE